MNILADMLIALGKLKDLGHPLTELRLHPDDYAELRAEAIKRSFQQTTPPGAEHAFGVRVIVDDKAPLLPRRAPRR